jgi:hypothetical protein
MIFCCMVGKVWKFRRGELNFVGFDFWVVEIIHNCVNLCIMLCKFCCIIKLNLKCFVLFFSMERELIKAIFLKIILG